MAHAPARTCSSETVVGPSAREGARFALSVFPQALAVKPRAVCLHHGLSALPREVLTSASAREFGSEGRWPAQPAGPFHWRGRTVS